MDIKVYCPKCQSDGIYWEEQTTNYHRAVYDSNFGMELAEQVDSDIKSGNFFCPDCGEEFDWDQVEEYMESRNA